MAELPSGTITLLFTDVEGSTNLLEHVGDTGYAQILADHRRLLRASFQTWHGHELEAPGDGFLVVFQSARDAVMAAVAAQNELSAHSWPEGAPVRVRMGLLTGEPIRAGEGYVGLDVHRAARISAAGHGGQILLSQSTRDLVQDILQSDVGLRDLGSHRLKDLARPEHIFQIVTPELASDFPPLKTLNTMPNNLPVQLTSFIGREKDIAAITGLFSTTRMLSITGPGGSGKTRLALQLAAEMVDVFGDGVWFVELASLSDPDLVPQTVASALGVREQPGKSLLATLVDYLRNKHLLLLLDNCEHLVTASSHLAIALLRDCRDLRILATSREALSIPGEILWRVPPLSLPDGEPLASPEELIGYEAVHLFVERVRSSQPKFALTDRNADAVVRVCRQLDGIPLALELAAARVRSMSVEQLAVRLNDKFRLLTGGPRTALPHHQTLQATIDWSYNLLSDTERALLRRLSVFSGGWTLEAAERICDGHGVEAHAVVDLLAHLADKSLIQAEYGEDEIRWGILETIRQYSRERLLESGEELEFRRRHRDWFTALVEEANLLGSDQGIWLDRLETEHDNLRAVLEWSHIDEQSAEAGLRLAGALVRFWVVRGYFTEGRARLETALSDSIGDSPARAKALHGAGVLAGHQGDYERADARCQEALALWQRLGDKLGMALAINTLGLVARTQGDYDRATNLLEQSLTLSREVGDKWSLALTLNGLGVVARGRGDYERARALHEESRALRKELGDQKGLAVSLERLGVVALFQGDLARAGSLLEESLTISRDVGDRLSIASAKCDLGLAALYQGDYTIAKFLEEEGLALFRELGDKAGVAASLNNLGRLAHAQRDHERAGVLFKESLSLWKELGDKLGIARGLADLAAFTARQNPEPAAQLYGASEALYEAIGAVPSSFERADHARDITTLRRMLGENAFENALARGKTATPEEAIEHALSIEISAPASFAGEAQSA